MSDNNPITGATIQVLGGAQVPNVFDHLAVHPAAYTVEIASDTVAATSQKFLEFVSPGGLHATNFSVWDFSLMQFLSVHLDVNQLGDLILQTAPFSNATFPSTPTEEMRFALNVGNNFIEYKPVGRWGRFILLNRAGAQMVLNWGQVIVRSVR